MGRKRSEGEPRTGRSQKTACAYYDGNNKVRLCPECLARLRKEPGAKEILLAEGPSRPNSGAVP